MIIYNSFFVYIKIILSSYKYDNVLKLILYIYINWVSIYYFCPNPLKEVISYYLHVYIFHDILYF